MDKIDRLERSYVAALQTLLAQNAALRRLLFQVFEPGLDPQQAKTEIEKCLEDSTKYMNEAVDFFLLGKMRDE